MKNSPPGDDVENLASLKPPRASEDWTEMLALMAETRDKSLYVDLFRHFAPRVKAYVLRLGVVPSAAEEVTQEIMLAVWRKAHLFNAAKAAASTWIFTLARNQSIDWMRSQKYPQYEFDDQKPETSEAASVPSAGEAEVLSDRMAAAIKTLPENQAQVIFMSFFEGRSHGEIANRLDIPLGSVKSRLRLASEKLRTLWGDAV
ncbi:MAG: sigma-70 family RNA polymerase sigma factor [Motiliproteus sp.]|nr:sigma-70 family RNA polymerase sigma factor [Motiliproteus sp.]MCW9053781.1 sigma-70 family RNA polymerase sigma factor [Motiliproteus sp.]